MNFLNNFQEFSNINEFYDNNIFENANELNTNSNNIFTKLNKLFENEYDRIYNNFKKENNISDIIKKNEIIYNAKDFLKNIENENKQNNNIIKNELEKEININFNDFNNNLINLKNVYTNKVIYTLNLESEIKKVLIKYDTYYKKIEKIYTTLNEFENIENHIQKIDDEISVLVKDYFEKFDIKNKIENYYKSIKEINVLKEEINKFNSISFIPYCQICMTKIVVRFIVPCGHTACSECLNKCNKNCFICRNEYTDIKKLFIN